MFGAYGEEEGGESDRENALFESSLPVVLAFADYIKRTVGYPEQLHDQSATRKIMNSISYSSHNDAVLVFVDQLVIAGTSQCCIKSHHPPMSVSMRQI